MSDLLPVDALRVTVVIDNTSDGLSTAPPHARSEMMSLAARPGVTLTGEALCCAHHGLSLLVECERAGRSATVLFDAGPEGAVFERNVGCLGAGDALGAVTDVVLSHGHWDHAGGLVRALERRRTVRRDGFEPALLHVHPGAFVSRAVQFVTGAIVPMRDVPSVAELERAGAEVVRSSAPAILGGGCFFLSGEIPRTTSYEKGFPGHVRRDASGAWTPDPLLEDERFLAVHVARRGIFVFTACSHAGIVNVLRAAAATFPSLPVVGVVGGLHLAGWTERIIGETVSDLKSFPLEAIAPGHCTGFRATAALLHAFGDTIVTPLAVGKRLQF